MAKYILIFFFSLLLASCGDKTEYKEKNINDASKVNDSFSYYQKAKNKVVRLFKEDEQQEIFIKKKVDISKKYEEYKAVKSWFQTSNLEILKNDRLNFYKIVKAETTYKNETTISYFTTPDGVIKYCYLNYDYIYFIDFNYAGNSLYYSDIKRLSRGIRFEDLEELIFNDEGKIERQVENDDDFRYTISKSEDGFHEITYKNMVWELRGNEKLVTTLTLDTPQYESSWKDGIMLDNLIEILLNLLLVVFVGIVLVIILSK